MADRLCEICNQEVFKYKCPSCRALYCSVPCYQKHKTKPCQALSLGIAPAQEQPLHPPQELVFEDEAASDVLSYSTLASLSSNDNLRAMLSNRHLRRLLDEVDTSTNPTESVKAAMEIAIFREFADECLKHCGIEVGNPDDT
eukprot:TRINITY_DN10327_c0_g3_i1.p1 TRINITY_DN10327_c0_g3~~TRINITY_DN10327_c0_g3_i1.p1  ORF type:complete len:142 (+),score=22.76 TRINITY_DN10327_c0_g3_i1:159-584(+)